MSELAQRSFSLVQGEILAGRYEIESGLGTGAMGEVYAAQDLELHEAIAIKLLRPEIARNERVLDRFKREIQLARRVTHQNVCRVFDLVIETEPSRVLLTMERLSGPTLAEHQEALGRIPLEEAIHILEEIAAGLDAAHAAGIVHRDLKSSNVILVAAEGARGARVVLTDFGVAWSETQGGGPGMDHLTASGQVVGSPAYMAPEQLRGQPVSARTDVYALGVLGYELFTGRLPFEGETAFLTAMKRIEEDPIPPERFVPSLPRHYGGVLLRALARSPVDRFAGAGAMMRAFNAAPVSAGPVSARLEENYPKPAGEDKAKRQSARRFGLWVLALLLGLAIWGLWRRSPAIEVAWLPSGLPEQEETRLLFRNGLEALSRDDLTAAKAFLSRALEKEPLQPAIAFALGEAWERLGHVKKAQESIDLACRDAASWPAADAARCTGRQAELAGDWPRAIETYQDLLAGDQQSFELGLRLASAQLRAGQVEAAENELAALRERLPAKGEQEGSALEALRLDLLQAEIHGAKASFEAQQEWGERAEKTASALKLSALRARALFEVGSGALGRGDYESAQSVLGESARIATELGDLRRRADAARKLGVVEERQGQLEAAEGRYREAQASYRELGDLLGEAKVANDLGTVLGAARRFAEAEQAYQQSLTLMREIGYPRGEAMVLLNLGSLPFRQGDLRLAKERFEQALPALQAVGDRHFAEVVEHNLATIAWLHGDLQAAEKALFLLAEQHQKERRGNYLTSQIFQGLAEIELERGKTREAESWARQALELREKLGEREPAFESRRLLAELSPARQESLAALSPLLDQLETAQPRVLLRFYVTLSRAWLDVGRPDLARPAFESAQEAADKVPAAAAWDLWPLHFLALRFNLDPAGLRQVEEQIAEATRLDLPQLALLGRLEVAVATGNTAALVAIENEARRGGFLELATRAAAQARRL